MRKFELETLLPHTPESVFAWHLRPGAFDRLCPPWQDIRLIERTGGVEDGATATVSMRRGPLRVRWTARHFDVSPPQRFCDEQVTGPFAVWRHQHEFLPAGASGCHVRDSIEYALPLGKIGDALGGRGVARDLARAFAFRHRRLAADLARHATHTHQPRQRIVISGANGLIGRSLAAFLTTGGHRVDRLVRHATRGDDEIFWDPDDETIDAERLEGADAVVHLAGENIAGQPWSSYYKARIRESRVLGTALLAGALAKLRKPPRVLISASATGIYGDRGDEVCDEATPAGAGFLADVAQEWEASADAARSAGIRVVHPRFGVVLAADGGALAKILRPFRLGVGGRLGSGRQYMSCISRDDAVYALHELLFDSRAAGPINLTSPDALTNAEFTRVLAEVLRRPAVLPVPAIVLRGLLGEMADALLLRGARVAPRKLRELGYRFEHATVEEALRAELGL